MNYDIVIVRLSPEDGGGYMGYAPDLMGCMSDGSSPEEALRNTQEAVQEWIAEQAPPRPACSSAGQRPQTGCREDGKPAQGGFCSAQAL